MSEFDRHEASRWREKWAESESDARRLRRQLAALRGGSLPDVTYADGSLWGASGGQLELLEIRFGIGNVELVFECHDHPGRRYEIKVPMSKGML